MAGPETLSDPGAVLDELRRKGLVRHSVVRHAVKPRPRDSEPTLSLENFSRTDIAPDVRKGRGVAVPASIILHTVGAAALALGPLFVADPLPVPYGEVRAFFIEPMAAPPTLPPPPPPSVATRVAASTRTRVAPTTPVAAPPVFVAPIDVPAEIEREEGLDLGGIEAGMTAGVEGGVPGGGVGGVIGGLPDALPPPPVKPVRVGGTVHEPRKVVDVAPIYPLLAARAGIKGIVIIEAMVDPRGRVVDATVIKGVPTFHEAALEAVRRWVYTPTLIDGVPTPIIMTVTVRFELTSAPS